MELTSTVTIAIMRALSSSKIEDLSTVLQVIGIGLLVALLIEKELIRVFGGPRSEYQLRALDMIIGPLLIMLGFVVVVRMAVILHLL